MSHSDRWSLAALTLLSVLLGGCTNKSNPDDGWIVVELSPTAKGICIVQNKEIRCDDAPHYLRNTLRIPADASIKVKCGKKCTRADDTIPVIDALKAAGYRLTMGELEI